MRNYTAALIMALMLAAPPAMAHHSGAMFDQTTTMTLEGTVSQFNWANPHVYIFVETIDASGQTIEWELETDSTAIMTRDGWTRDSLTPGMRVSVRANPARNIERSHARLLSLVKEDGQLFTRRSSRRASTVRADSIAGVWDAIRNLDLMDFTIGTPTEKGAAARAAFSNADYPAANCIPYATPHLMTLAPYRFEIDVEDERVVINGEFFNVVRTIYTDGRAHPENAERFNQGHSIGHWEDDVLVVDTTHFADDPSGNMRGIPSGAQKHAIERFHLSEDGTQLIIEYVVEDPEFLSEPTIGTSVWDYAADGEMLPFGCDIENASFYFLQ
ncbi:MAG: DUF6152 family protein [Micropepsaceae bacterium]